ncbi:MAG: corrinoid protein [Chloroflexi bacterium]|nr:corrinoid protein [Chloroflexota bacterium]
MPQTQVLVQQALDQGLSANEILNRALIPAMTEVGARFERSEFYVPEMLIAARAMKEGLALLKPKLAQASVKPIGRVIIGTVVGDLHDIGKNLVGIMMEGMGLEVIDLGVDVAPAKFVEAVRDTAPQIIGMSALLTTTMTAMKATIEALKAAGLRDKVKVMVGGAPVTHKFAETIGADVYASDAASAASRARALLQSN